MRGCLYVYSTCTCMYVCMLFYLDTGRCDNVMVMRNELEDSFEERSQIM